MDAMNRPRWRIVISVLLSCALLPGVALSQSCGGAPCSPNPTPCAQCTGTWTDNYGDQWTVSSPDWPSAPGSQRVSGSVTIPAEPLFGCPS